MMETIQKCPPSYYSVLGVGSNSSDDEIRRAYRRLAMQWHPDRWTRTPCLLGEAKSRFQQIQEAYSVLSNQRKRTMYDAGLYDPDDEEDEGLSDFVQEMLSLMADTKGEERCYSLEELQGMFLEMVRDFDSSQWFSGASVLDGSGRSKKARCEMNPGKEGRSQHWQEPGLELYGTSGYCN